MSSDSLHNIASDTGTTLQGRRLLLRSLLGAPLAVLAAGLAGCGIRRDLPEERRTRGKYGHSGD